MKLSTSKQSGFTLVEIAIVLVIIGVLLAGVLKGQSLINNSRIKGLVNNMNAVSTAYNGYIDRYQASPGTEPIGTINARGWLGTTAPTSAILNAASLPLASTFVSANDQIPFFQVLGAAGFLAYTQTSVTNPPSATGGAIGVTFSPYGMLGVSVCLSALPPQLAEGVDVVIDGPLPATNVGNNVGSLRGAAAAAIPLAPVGGVPGAVAYSETAATFWSVCKTL